jgi:hypothetical protein
MRDMTPKQRLGRLSLEVDGPDGGRTRLRVGVRGNQVDASVTVAESGAADTLRNHTDELQRSLRQHGLEAESLRFRGADAASESREGQTSRDGRSYQRETGENPRERGDADARREADTGTDQEWRRPEDHMPEEAES